MNGATSLLPESTRIGRTALTVSDRTAVIEFYRDVVGLSVLTRESATGTTTLGVDETSLLVVRDTADAQPRSREETGLYHSAFKLPSREALGDALLRVRDWWELDGASDHGVSEALYLTDPEDNGVELYRDRPRSEWPRDEDGGIRIGSSSLDLEDLAAAASGDIANTAPDGTTVGHIHLEVSSIDDARAFYAETLGFDVVDTAPSAMFLAAGEYHHHIGTNTWNGRSEPLADGSRGLAWFELVVPATPGLEAIRAALEERGLTSTRVDDGLEIADPDGIRIRLRTER
ncbi:VOC family protein [Natronorubrum sp. JWXQ-INN-674]|uniref:VOC family protein n=1 Tax=Natronorubrum halalkaliphilum TaxID=2691917 RepID=A0A6B0VUF7_9EURY|nr:VOC family protein [Natronorubrum halalkaliphilum]MXV64536.1 VOC family protein [Natronorubrum halalkaliphilum]